MCTQWFFIGTATRYKVCGTGKTACNPKSWLFYIFILFYKKVAKCIWKWKFKIWNWNENHYFSVLLALLVRHYAIPHMMLAYFMSQCVPLCPSLQPQLYFSIIFLPVQQMPLDFSLFIPDPATPICSPVTSFPSPEPPHPSPNLYFVPWSATHYVYHPRSFVRLSVFLSCYVSLLAFGFASELFVTWNWACLPLCLLSVYLLSVYMPACLPTCTCQWAIFV